MSEIKFACANCNQHIAVDRAWGGRKVLCPACQADLVIPTVPPPIPQSALLVPASIAYQQPASFSPAPMHRPQAARTLCVLAPVALLLVVATPLVALIQTATIPYVPLTPACLLAGLICSHVALNRINRNASLSGKPWAVVGLCLGYLLLIATIVSVIYIVGIRRGWFPPPQNSRPRMIMSGHPRPSLPVPGRSFNPGAPTPVLPGQRGYAPRPEPRSTLQVKNTVTGTVAGQPFNCDHARLLGSMLELRQGKDVLPDTTVTLFMLAVGDPAGRTITAPSTRSNGHLTLRWRENGMTKFKTVPNGYSLRLEFGQRNGDLIPGKISLDLPGNPSAKIEGEFTAEMR